MLLCTPCTLEADTLILLLFSIDFAPKNKGFDFKSLHKFVFAISFYRQIETLKLKPKAALIYTFLSSIAPTSDQTQS